MFLGYNTNGLAHHDLFDAVDLLAEIGYRGIAVTIDHGTLSPRDPAFPEQLDQLALLIRARRLATVIETGARYLLDPRRKHEPTLVSSDRGERERRIAFYRHCIDCARRLGSRCVSIWSGALRDGAEEGEVFDRLAGGLRAVLDYGAKQGVAVALEPEPGMFIDSQRRFAEFLERFPLESLKLTVDVGHLQCAGETPIGDQIRHWRSRLVNLHLDDAVTGRHEHLMFGRGEVDFADAFSALGDIGYEGGLYVELSRHSHAAPEAARQAMEFLSPLIESGGRSHA